MTAIWRWLVFAAVLAIAGVAQFPLRLAGLDRAGVTARAAQGTIWSGRLDDASWRGVPIGDIEVGLSTMALLGGRLRLDFGGAAIRGTLVRRAGGSGVTGLSGGVGPLQIGGVAMTALTFEAVEIGFAAGTCAEAAGVVRLQPAAGLGAGDALVGAPRCDGDALVLPLASASGKQRLDMRVDADRHYRATLAIDNPAEAQRAALLAAGFRPTPAGLALSVEGEF